MHRRQPHLLAVALFVLTSATPSLAADLVRSGGVLGSSVTYDLDGTPGAFVVLGISTTEGPIPLALVDPTDPRLLDIGLDLLDFWTLTGLDLAGEASASYPLPLNPGLAGVALHAQTVEMPLVPQLFGPISNRCTFTLGFPKVSALAFGQHVINVAGHTATLLQDGRVLIGGGYQEDGEDALDKLSLFDPQTETFAAPASVLSAPRFLHTATPLDDGRVLFVGGLDQDENVVATAEIYDPVSDTVVATPPMSAKRGLHTATKLNDGRVIVVGGASLFDENDIDGVINSIQRSTELYDPIANTWTPGPDLPRPRGAHASTLLQDGRVLVTGGIEVTIVIIFPVPIISDNCQIYDPVTSSFTTTPQPMPGVRALHSILSLSDGRVVVAGGAHATLIPLAVTPLNTTAVFFPTFDAWLSAAPLNLPRGYGVLAESAGEIVIMGGIEEIDIAAFNPEVPGLQTIERADFFVTSWTATEQLVMPRRFGGAFTPIDGGQRILVSGEGDNGLSEHDLTAEIYVP